MSGGINGVWGIKIYTKTKHEKINGKYYAKTLGVIEAPINKMLKAYKKEFSFMRHETTRDSRPSKRGSNAISKKSQS